MKGELEGPAPGARAPRLTSEEETARWVRFMFARVVPRYDLLNHLLSFNLDRWWRGRAARRLRPMLRQPRARVLDLCCGTGDLLLALAAQGARSPVGADFCHPMLEAARRKLPPGTAYLVEADALRLPFPADAFEAVTVGFGFRNLANYRSGLAEMLRVLRPGGVAAILEFSRPPHPLLARLYDFYSRRILPRIGGSISGCPEAYSYLPDSVRNFPGPGELAAEMRRAGFHPVAFELFTGGIVALHLGWKPGEGKSPE
jgi:demethylmenaquinone methyltransferase/2-methoxy-6-polyprenyl-1,4-benzoquinol methylase